MWDIFGKLKKKPKLMGEDKMIRFDSVEKIMWMRWKEIYCFLIKEKEKDG